MFVDGTLVVSGLLLNINARPVGAPDTESEMLSVSLSYVPTLNDVVVLPPAVTSDVNPLPQQIVKSGPNSTGTMMS